MRRAIEVAKMASTNPTADQNVKDGEMVQQAPAQATDPFEGHRETINPFSNDEKAKPAPTFSPIFDRRASSDEWGKIRSPIPSPLLPKPEVN